MPGASTGVPTHDKAMWESSGGQGEPELEGCPSGPAWASTPKPESVCFTASWPPFQEEQLEEEEERKRKAKQNK